MTDIKTGLDILYCTQLLDSRWVMSDSRPRRYYKLTAAGARALKDLVAQWRLISKGLDRLLR